MLIVDHLVLLSFGGFRLYDLLTRLRTKSNQDQPNSALILPMAGNTSRIALIQDYGFRV